MLDSETQHQTAAQRESRERNGALSVEPGGDQRQWKRMSQDGADIAYGIDGSDRPRGTNFVGQHGFQTVVKTDMADRNGRDRDAEAGGSHGVANGEIVSEGIEKGAEPADPGEHASPYRDGRPEARPRQA